MAESIYNLIPQPVPPVIKPPIHRSKHPGDKPPTFSTFGMTGTSKPGYKNVQGAEMPPTGGHHEYRKSHATMGMDNNAPLPSEILRKGTGAGAGAGDATRMGSTAGLSWTAPPPPLHSAVLASPRRELPRRRRLAT